MGIIVIFPEDSEDECQLVAVLVGLKTIVNEFAAYDRLSAFKGKMSPRSIAIATYALCGFSNPASIGNLTMQNDLVAQQYTFQVFR